MNSCRIFSLVLFLFTQSGAFGQSAPPFVTYAGQVASDGQPYNGTGQFKFAFVNADANVTYWSQDGTSTSGSEPSGFVSVQVNGGYYSILLGNTAISGMAAIDPAIFKTYADVHLRIWFSDGVAAFEEMTPHRPFASVPYALNAGVADGSISSAKLESTILTYLKPEVSGPPKVVRSLVDFQKKITLESGATGKYLTYQWKKNGSTLPGETNATLVISEANATYDGNYTVSVSNAFGSVESTSISLATNKHIVPSAANLEMLWVEPGAFRMGVLDMNKSSWRIHAQFLDQYEEKNMTINHGFYMGKYEVTQAQYESVMTGISGDLNATPSHFHDYPNRPVEMVSYNDIEIFLSRLNSLERDAGRLPVGWSYHLPSVPEWEYVYRAGSETLYHWGDDVNASLEFGNVDSNQTADVGSFLPNAWGFYDMSGNVGEILDERGRNHSSISNYWRPRTGRWYNPNHYSTFNISQKNLEPVSFNIITSSNLNRRWQFVGFRISLTSIPLASEDYEPPSLTLLGDQIITCQIGQYWTDPGSMAFDERDGNLTNLIVKTGYFNKNELGSYPITYSVSDTAGNSVSKIRVVDVKLPDHQASTYSVASAGDLEMIWVSEGNFTMGSPVDEIGRSEIANRENEHNVTLTSGFYLGKFEVTQAQYETVMNGDADATPSKYPGNPNRPVDNVSRSDVSKFLQRLNSIERTKGLVPAGWSYVLPTEAQWEYACRAGTNTTYWFGNTISSTDANWNHGSDPNRSIDVGQFSANPWGFFDMHGNVGEWTSGKLYYYPPASPGSYSNDMRRGGSYGSDAAKCRSAYRGSYSSDTRSEFIGFRLAFQKQ